MVRRSWTSARKRASEPCSSKLGRDTVSGKFSTAARSRLGAPDFGPPAMARAGRATLEIDIPGIAQQLRFHRNMQAVMNGVVELPEAHHASELDDLRRRQMLLEPLQQVVWHRGRIL